MLDPRERIQIDGELISEPAWCEAFEAVHAAAEGLLAREEIDAHPSFFETVTAMAFVAFATASVEVVVLETGLGGRLDATNLVDPEIAVITPIDFDHEAFLGSSIESIAAEKAGILKAGRPAVFAAQRPEAFRVLERRALELEIPVTLSSAWRVEDLAARKIRQPLHSGRRTKRFRSFVRLRANIRWRTRGLRSRRSSIFGVSAAAIGEGIERAEWPGRLERVATDPDIILDGAHNPAGARALAAYIRRFFRIEPDPHYLRSHA